MTKTNWKHIDPKIVSLRKEGKPFSEIAKELKVSEASLYMYWRRTYGDLSKKKKNLIPVVLKPTKPEPSRLRMIVVQGSAHDCLEVLRGLE